MLSEIMPNVTYEAFILSVIMLSVFIVNFFMLNIIMLSVVEPQIDSQRSKILSQICGSQLVIRLMHIDNKVCETTQFSFFFLFGHLSFPGMVRPVK